MGISVGIVCQVKCEKREKNRNLTLSGGHVNLGKASYVGMKRDFE